jgi:hypothetical protein
MTRQSQQTRRTQIVDEEEQWVASQVAQREDSLPDPGWDDHMQDIEERHMFGR